MEFYRETWVEVNLNAIGLNTKQLKAHIPDETQIMAIVKADAYGHGAYPVAFEALSSGATWLGVALLDEALSLRQKGIKAPILVLGWTRPADIAIAAEHNISLTVFQAEWIKQAREQYQSQMPVFLHIKCDTGMGRIGIRETEEMDALADAFRADPRFIVEGIFTHFATADENDPTYFNKQYQRFTTMLTQLMDRGINPNLVHCANSAAALKHPDKLFNMVRYGIAMYGLSPSEQMKSDLPFQLQQAFSLKTSLVHVKQIEAGESVSYGATFTATEPTWIGTLPIGYADGWLRRLAGHATVLVKGKRFPIVGRICMDQMMIQLDAPYPLGEEVTLIGSSGNEYVSIDEISGYLGTINYEVPCMINHRVPRLYFKNDERIAISNPIIDSASILEEKDELDKKLD
ncbi:alanine racemase 1 [Pullulanibacillus camelliae]|uniref:Alanine racemase n=1 Tax=Pullulanibacillus camelliae TaxID=1707096 RepID=A0A8J2VNT2_9BACL|nr:alanine racemase [Pullulanibacillus camelliae]GGE34396.1 alanine racemase 1 [Pullulanibacillus camelliae]